MTNIILQSLPEFLNIKNIKTKNASTNNHPHPHICIHFPPKHKIKTHIIAFGECKQLQTNVGGTYSLLEESLQKSIN